VPLPLSPENSHQGALKQKGYGYVLSTCSPPESPLRHGLLRKALAGLPDVPDPEDKGRWDHAVRRLRAMLMSPLFRSGTV